MLSHKTSHSNESSFSDTGAPSHTQPIKRPLLNFDRFEETTDFGASDSDNVDTFKSHELFESNVLEDDMEVQDNSVTSFIEEWANDQDELLYQQSSEGHKEPRHIIRDNAIEDNDATENSSHISSSIEESESSGHYEMIQGDEEEAIQRSTADNTARWNPLYTGSGPSIPTLHTHKKEESKPNIPSAFEKWLHERQLKDAESRNIFRERDISQPLIPEEKQRPQEAFMEADQDDDDVDESSLDGNSDAVQSLLRHFEEHDLEIHQEADEETMLNKLRSRFNFQPEVDFEYGIKCVAKRICSIKPFMHWRTLRALDLSYQHLTTLIDLEDIVPNLEALDVSNNALSDMPRLPKSLQTLKAKTNRLVNIRAFQHLSNLHYLDICNNAVNSFEGASHLNHLRTIHAESNKISSCGPLKNLRGLIHLNLRANSIKQFSFQKTRMENLETLDVSYNRIESLDSIESLVNLRVLMLDHNDVKWIHLESPMAKLKVLRICYNRLRAFDGSNFPDLRTLYMDDNQIVRIIGLSCIPRLASFSMRDQGGQRVEINMKYLRAARKLYMSGNALKHISDIVDFFTLEYLELCSVQLEELPEDFSRRVPNLGALYLSHNYLQDIHALRKLRHLRKLVLIDNRISSLSSTLATIKSLGRLQHLDLRQNPITAKLYPPVKTQDANSIASYLVNEHDQTWASRDTSFTQALPQHWNERRQSYRALCIKYRPRLVMLDGVQVTEDETKSVDAICAALSSKYNNERQ